MRLGLVICFDFIQGEEGFKDPWSPLQFLFFTLDSKDACETLSLISDSESGH